MSRHRGFHLEAPAIQQPIPTISQPRTNPNNKRSEPQIHSRYLGKRFQPHQPHQHRIQAQHMKP